MTTLPMRCQPDGLQISVMRAMLTKWGSICEASRSWNGYPSADTTYRAAFGRGGGGEKRLPIPGVPSFAIQLSAEVMKLPDEEGNAITIIYAHHFNAANEWMTPGDKARLLGIGLKALRYRERCGIEKLVILAPYVIDSWHEWQESRAAVAQLGQPA